MNFPVLLDVAIGLTLVYLGASLLVSVINEYVAQFLKLRAKQLAKDLHKLIDDPALRTSLGANPALARFFGDAGGGKAAPGSYVDPKVLAQQLIGGLGAAQQGLLNMKEIAGAIDSLPGDSMLKKNLQALCRVSNDNVQAFLDSVGVWVDQSLTMMGEVYKKNAQNLCFVIGLGLAAGFNIDSIGIVHHLYRDKEAREAMSALGADVVQQTSKETLEKCQKLTYAQMQADTGCAGLERLLDGLRQRNDTFGALPIGWPARPVGDWPVALTAALGWLITALAISLGATFWFDLLGRLVNVRHGMRKPVPAVETAASPSSSASSGTGGDAAGR